MDQGCGVKLSLLHANKFAFQETVVLPASGRGTRDLRFQAALASSPTWALTQQGNSAEQPSSSATDMLCDLGEATQTL